MSRPRIELSEDDIQRIEKLAAVLRLEDIAWVLGISPRTLDRRLSDDERARDAYEKGRANAIATVATNLLQQARSGNITAQIFYLKTQAGWKEVSRNEVTGKDGGPVETMGRVTFYVPANEREG